MFYSKPLKDESGTYVVKAYTDEKKKCFVQVSGNITHEDGEVSFLLNDTSKIQNIDDENLKSAKINSEEWFGKKVNDATLDRVYTKSLVDTQVTSDVIKATKIFNSEKKVIKLEEVVSGSECTGLLEFAGLWFVKKAFGPIWNVVQVKVHPVPEPEPEPEPQPEPEPEPEVNPDDEYPDEYAISDDN